MTLDDKSKLILLQNLTNRAVDIAIANAAVESRKVEMSEVDQILSDVTKLVIDRVKKI